MPKSLTTQPGRYLHPATASGPRPGDFPVGSLKSRAAARALLANRKAEQLGREAAEFGELNEFELAYCEGFGGGARRQAIQVARVLQASAETWGPLLETPEEIRRSRAVGKIFGELTGGRMPSDGMEEKRLRDLAEEKFLAGAAIQSKEKRTKAQAVDVQFEE